MRDGAVVRALNARGCCRGRSDGRTAGTACREGVRSVPQRSVARSKEGRRAGYLYQHVLLRLAERWSCEDDRGGAAREAVRSHVRPTAAVLTPGLRPGVGGLLACPCPRWSRVQATRLFEPGGACSVFVKRLTVASRCVWRCGKRVEPVVKSVLTGLSFIAL